MDQRIMADYNNEESIKRLKQRLEASARKMKPFRQRTHKVVEQLAGYNYGDHGYNKRVPMNLIELTSEVYIDNLAAQSPRALVTTAHRELKPFAVMLEMALNHLVNEIKFGDTLQDVVQDALFSWGIVKIGIGDGPNTLTHNDTVYNVGQPFVEAVQFEDFIVDMSATRWCDIRFAGHRYRIPLHVLRESRRYSKELLDKLHAKGPTNKTPEGDDRLNEMSGSAYTGNHDDMDVELIDVWLPQDKVVVTLEYDGLNKPLHVMDWNGPEAGPFETLCFRRVPGNLLPLPPASTWMDNHDLINRLARKLGDQADRQKTVATCSPQHAKYGQRMLEAEDGEVIPIVPGSQLEEHTLGGIRQETFAYMLQLNQIHSRFAGNLDSLGGLSAMSETVGQDELLAANASQRIRRMQGCVYDFAHRVLKQLAWYLWTDPFIEIPLVKRIGVLELPVRYTSEQMEGDFLDYNFLIEPYSMQPQTPEARIRTMLNLLTQVYMPALPMLQQQGGSISWQIVNDLMSRYTQLPELKDVVQFDSPMMMQANGGPVQPNGGQTTTRRIYERRNRPAASNQGAEQVLINTLMGGNNQLAEKAAAVR